MNQKEKGLLTFNLLVFVSQNLIGKRLQCNQSFIVNPLDKEMTKKLKIGI